MAAKLPEGGLASMGTSGLVIKDPTSSVSKSAVTNVPPAEFEGQKCSPKGVNSKLSKSTTNLHKP